MITQQWFLSEPESGLKSDSNESVNLIEKSNQKLILTDSTRKPIPNFHDLKWHLSRIFPNVRSLQFQFFVLLLTCCFDFISVLLPVPTELVIVSMRVQWVELNCTTGWNPFWRSNMILWKIFKKYILGIFFYILLASYFEYRSYEFYKPHFSF